MDSSDDDASLSFSFKLEAIGDPPPQEPADLLFSSGRFFTESSRSYGSAKRMISSPPKRVSFKLCDARGRRSVGGGGGSGVRRVGSIGIGRVRNIGVTEKGGGGGQKMRRVGVLGMLAAACRQCHAFEPSKCVAEERAAAPNNCRRKIG